MPAAGRKRGDLLPLEGEVRGFGSGRGALATGVGGRQRATEEERRLAGHGPGRAEKGTAKKVVGPQAERDAVHAAQAGGPVSERCAGGLLEIEDRGGDFVAGGRVVQVLEGLK